MAQLNDLLVKGQSRFLSPVYVNSWIEAQSFNAISDRHLKTNFTSLQTERSILDLPLYKFDYINGPKNQIGCTAQDLQQICPEIVQYNEKGYLTIQENKIVYLLIDEIKKLRDKINYLEKVSEINHGI